jgi:hypothetical protein
MTRAEEGLKTAKNMGAGMLIPHASISSEDGDMRLVPLSAGRVNRLKRHRTPFRLQL